MDFGEEVADYAMPATPERLQPAYGTGDEPPQAHARQLPYGARSDTLRPRLILFQISNSLKKEIILRS